MKPSIDLTELMARLRRETPGEAPWRILVIAAHPDDEIIGAGVQLPHWPAAEFVVVTDGSPRNLADAGTAGFRTREEYKTARREELAAALALAGQGRNVRELGFIDQETSLNLPGLARSFLEILRVRRPDVVLTHPYEGGHPDHDATAFGVHAAAALLDRDYGWQPLLLEMTSYHARAGGMVSGEFLPEPTRPVITFALGPDERAFKRRLFDCFRTQTRVLAGFAIEHERFRRAPVYDFTAPPHQGPAYYEMFNWGTTGECWREFAVQALKELHLVRPELESENREYVFNSS